MLFIINLVVLIGSLCMIRWYREAQFMIRFEKEKHKKPIIREIFYLMLKSMSIVFKN